MLNDDIRKEIFKYVLQNAVFYGGKPNPGAVLGKIISVDNSLKTQIKELREEIQKAINEAVGMDAEKQKKMLEELAPELLVKEKKEEGGLPELKDAEMGKVVTRFAPSPTGPLTLGQFLRAVTISHVYAEKYKGKFILRIEDTDAKKIKKDFIEWMKDDLVRCGINPDECVHQSDRLPIYYEYAEKMIYAGKAYVCTCTGEAFRELKNTLNDCPCRTKNVDKNKSDWKKMKDGDYDDGEAVLRLKTSMQDKNPVMRDPPVFRMNKASHPLKGTEYKVWPLYNFSCACDDHLLGITHVFRGKEHEHNTAVQNIIYDFFGWKKPDVVNFGMIRFPGMVRHSREMRELVESGKASGWDDPQLPTIRALLRRGFRPEALKNFAISCGLSKNDIQSSWENLEAENKKVIDPIAKRFMVVTDPKKISIKGVDNIQDIEEPLHPDNESMGTKMMPVNAEEIYVSGDDYEKLHGKVVRLKGLFNVKLDENTRFESNDIVREMPKIQWVSVPNVDIIILKSGSSVNGLGENAMKGLSEGDIIQMERNGFGRIDKKEENKITVVFGHK